MEEKISKGIFWIISVGCFLAFLDQVINKPISVNILLPLALGIVTNPFILDSFYDKNGVETIDYSYVVAVKMLFAIGGVLIAFILAFLIFKHCNSESDINIAMQNFEAILKITVFIIYLIVLFMYKSANRFLKYIIFAIFYGICIILSFSSQSINEYIIYILNLLNDGGLDLESYKLLINDFMIPIKEAILTYIIFDTVIEYKKKSKIKRKQDVVNRNHFPV